MNFKSTNFRADTKKKLQQLIEAINQSLKFQKYIIYYLRFDLSVNIEYFPLSDIFRVC